MKYTVTYSRKVRTGPYEVMEIGLSEEFDETTPKEEAFASVQAQVEKWIGERKHKV